MRAPERGRLERLRSMALLVHDHEAALLGAINQRHHQLSQMIARLDCQADAGDNLQLQQQYYLYEKWAAEKRKALLAELARCEAEREARLNEARRAFARERLMAGLIEKARVGRIRKDSKREGE